LAQKDQGVELCKGIERLGKCPEDKIPSLTPANKTFWRTFDRILPGLIRDRGYDYGAIKLVFDTTGLSAHLQEIYMDMINDIIEIIHKARKRKNDG